MVNSTHTNRTYAILSTPLTFNSSTSQPSQTTYCILRAGFEIQRFKKEPVTVVEITTEAYHSCNVYS